MIIESTPSNPPPPRKPRLRFSLLALLLFVTAACVLLAWAVQPCKYVIETLFQINVVPPSIFGNAHSPTDLREFEILRHTQMELIRKDFVLEAALRDPKIAALPVVKSQKDAVAWLCDHLDVESSANSELLAIRMRCAEGAINDYRAILDSVAAAYQNVVVFDDDQLRLVTRDALAKQVSKGQRDLQSKMEVLEKRTKESGKDSPIVRLAQAEIDVLTEIWRKSYAELSEMDMEAEAPKRIMLIQPATAKQE
jgi:hypothetical protein